MKPKHHAIQQAKWSSAGPGRELSARTAALLMFFAWLSFPFEIAAQTTNTLTPTPSAGPEESRPRFHLEIEPDSVTIGELVQVKLRCDDPTLDPERIREVTFQPDPEKWHVEQVWQRNWAGGTEDQPGPWQAVLRPFDTGRLELPETKIAYVKPDGAPFEEDARGEAVTVRSVRTGEEDALLGLRGPDPVPRDYGWIWWAGAAALGCGLLAVLAARILRRRRGVDLSAPAAPELPPGLWALEELDRRSRLAGSRGGPAKVIFTHVSEVIRLYAERRYGINAIDLTTHELMLALQARTPGEEALRWIGDFLDECDMVKFTTIEPARERWATIWNDARLIVKMTTPAHELLPGGVEAAPATAIREASA